MENERVFVATSYSIAVQVLCLDRVEVSNICREGKLARERMRTRLSKFGPFLGYNYIKFFFSFDFSIFVVVVVVSP